MLTIAMTVYKRSEYTDKTIKSILENKKNPIEFLILVDNAWAEEKKRMRQLNDSWNKKDWTIALFNQLNDDKINWLRNLAFEVADWENIFVINDDIEVSKEFDEKIEAHLTWWNIVNPVFRSPYEEWLRYKDNNISWHARAIKKSDREKIWKIDSRLKLRYWDDYIFHNAIDHWLKIKRIDDVEVFHRVSKTLTNAKIQQEVKLTKLDDQEWRKQILKEKRRHDFRFETF